MKDDEKKPFHFEVNEIIPLAGLKARYVLSVLKYHGGNKQDTIKALWIPLGTLVSMLRKWYGRA